MWWTVQLTIYIYIYNPIVHCRIYNRAMTAVLNAEHKTTQVLQESQLNKSL